MNTSSVKRSRPQLISAERLNISQSSSAEAKNDGSGNAKKKTDRQGGGHGDDGDPCGIPER